MYEEYAKRLREGDMTADFLRSLYTPEEGVKAGQREDFADRVTAIHQELLDQQQRAGGKIPVAGGSIGKDDAVWDMAFRLAETGTSSLYDLGQRQVERTQDGYNSPETYMDTELYHKPTGAAVDFKRSSSGTDLNYNLQFSPDGMPVMYTQDKPSDWVEFREDTLRPMVNFAAPFIPGAGPYIAAANAAYAASKGDWEKALLSGLSAAVPLAGKFGAGAETVGTLNNVRQAANVLKALESKDLLGAAMSGAGLAGVTEVGGYSMKDINQAVGMVKALESEDPTAIIRAGMGYLPKGGFDGPKSSDMITGYFEPGGEGYINPPTYAPDTKGYFDEITGHFMPDENGALSFGDLTNETSGTNIGSMDDYQYNPDTGNWTLPDGTVIDTSYMQNSKTPLTGQQIMNSAGAGAPKTPGAAAKPPAGVAKSPAKPGQGIDINQLASLLGGGQQAAPTIVSSGQENAADVQLMEDIFGTSLSAPPAGDSVTQARELARLLRS
jgi:hypothetical protein